MSTNSLQSDCWASVNGRAMFARCWSGPRGAPPPAIVLIHGLGMSSRCMVPTAVRLAPRYRVYAPDLPGHGRSPRAPGIPTVEALAGALLAWLDAADLAWPALLGNSLGCQVIAALVARRPQRIAAAIWVSPTMDPRARSVAAQALRLLRDAPREPPALWGLAVTEYLRAGPLRMLQTLNSALGDPLPARLPAMRLPVLVVAGARDPVAPPAWAASVARGLPDGRLVTLGGAPHAINYSRPADLARVVDAFVRGLPAGRTAPGAPGPGAGEPPSAS